MGLFQELRDKLHAAMKESNVFAKNVLRTLIGEVERTAGGVCGKEVPDADVRNVIKKTITNNREVIDTIMKNAKEGKGYGLMLEARMNEADDEIRYLMELIPDCLLPKLVEMELRAISADLINAKRGSAIGQANKYLKSKKFDYFGDDVVAAVRLIRGS